MLGLGAQRTSKKATKAKAEPGVVEPDNRIVFAVLAVGMLVGALLTTPAKQGKHVDLTTPTQSAHVASAAR